MAGERVEKGDKYTCKACGGEFVASRPHRDKIAESETLFGEIPEGDRVVVCHDCWLKIMRGLGHRVGPDSGD